MEISPVSWKENLKSLMKVEKIFISFYPAVSLLEIFIVIYSQSILCIFMPNWKLLILLKIILYFKQLIILNVVNFLKGNNRYIMYFYKSKNEWFYLRHKVKKQPEFPMRETFYFYSVTNTSYWLDFTRSVYSILFANIYRNKYISK